MDRARLLGASKHYRPLRAAHLRGILWAPVSGKSMAELIIDGEPSCVDLSAFSPSRFMPKVTSPPAPSRLTIHPRRVLGKRIPILSGQMDFWPLWIRTRRYMLHGRAARG